MCQEGRSQMVTDSGEPSNGNVDDTPGSKRPAQFAPEPLPESDDLISLLPHARPFLFVDGVTAIEPGTSIQAFYRMKPDEFFFPGHFPGNPIVPGVILIEALAQAGAIAVLAAGNEGRLPLLAGVDEARFRSPVLPGDTVTFTVDIERLRPSAGWARGVASVNGSVAASGRVMFAFAS